jgi:hypothetical protein
LTTSIISEEFVKPCDILVSDNGFIAQTVLMWMPERNIECHVQFKVMSLSREHQAILGLDWLALFHKLLQDWVEGPGASYPQPDSKS